jgi:hypothetical protein
MRSIAVVVAVAVVSLSGWFGVSAQGAGGAGAASRCTGSGACKVDVTVVNCVITPSPATLTVAARNVVIFWELDAASTSMYQFPEDGITLKTASPEFDQPGPQANNKKFKLHNKNSLAGQHSYPYTIRVQRLVGTQWTNCAPLDPVIVNEG